MATKKKKKKTALSRKIKTGLLSGARPKTRKPKSGKRLNFEPKQNVITSEAEKARDKLLSSKKKKAAKAKARKGAAATRRKSTSGPARRKGVKGGRS